MERLRKIDFAETLALGLAFIALLCFVVILTVITWKIATLTLSSPSASARDVRGIVKQCNDSSWELDADGFLRCLDNNGVSLSYYGEPVDMDGDA